MCALPVELAHPPAESTLVGIACGIRPKLLGQREHQVLLCRDDGFHVTVARIGEIVEDFLHKHLGHRRTAGDTDRCDTVEPLLLDLARVVDAVRRLRAVLEGNVDKSNGVRAVGATHNDDQLGLLGNLLDGDLAILGGVTDVVARRILQRGESLAQQANGLHRLVHTQCRLGEPDEAVGVGDHNVRHIRGAVDEGRALGRVAHGALDLLVAVVSNEQDLVVVSREPGRLAVNLRDEGARGVDGLEVSICGTLHNGG